MATGGGVATQTPIVKLARKSKPQEEPKDDPLKFILPTGIGRTLKKVLNPRSN